MATRKDVEAAAQAAGLYVSTYSPGDGVTRYRFFESDTDYFAGSGLFTALGPSEALGWLQQRSGFQDPEADELLLFIENTGELYPHIQTIYKNLRKYAGLVPRKGPRSLAPSKYDSEKAVKAFAWLVERGAKLYGKEMGSGEKDGLRMFPPAVRVAVARELVKAFESDPWEHGA